MRRRVNHAVKPLFVAGHAVRFSSAKVYGQSAGRIIRHMAEFCKSLVYGKAVLIADDD
jgi:predicted ester cyclase